MACIPDFEYAINGRCVVVLETLTLIRHVSLEDPALKKYPIVDRTIISTEILASFRRDIYHRAVTAGLKMCLYPQLVLRCGTISLDSIPKM